MVLLGFTWVLRENIVFINLLMPMVFKDKNQEVLLSGSENQAKNLVIDLKKRFPVGFP